MLGKRLYPCHWCLYEYLSPFPVRFISLWSKWITIFTWWMVPAVHRALVLRCKQFTDGAMCKIRNRVRVLYSLELWSWSPWPPIETGERLLHRTFPSSFVSQTSYWAFPGEGQHSIATVRNCTGWWPAGLSLSMCLWTHLFHTEYSG